MHSKTIPWKEILISGFILDPDRKKMSKSKGNVVTPQHLLDNYGADSVRYWASRARLGVDTAFEEQIMAQGKKLINKIFNASKFVFSMVENSPLKGISEYESHITNPMDKSWLYKMDTMMKQASSNFVTYDYASALELIEKRFWDLLNGGKIQYVKYPIDYNTEAVETLILRAMDLGFYEGVNLSLSYCDDCGHQELNMDVCPKCGSSNLTKIDRMNGYLSYSRVKGDTRLAKHKMDEIADRVSM